MNTYKVAICDDESLTCQEIETILIENSQQIGAKFDAEIFYTGEALIESIRCGSSYDFLILDIELARMSGIVLGISTLSVVLYNRLAINLGDRMRKIYLEREVEAYKHEMELMRISNRKEQNLRHDLRHHLFEIEGLAKQGEGEKRIVLTMQFSAGILFLQIKNTYNGPIRVEGGHVLGKKSKNNHGIGLRSVQDLVREQNGSLDISVTDQFFVAEGMIPVG